MAKYLILLFALALIVLPWEASSHRSGCHRWHSCPSDRGTYICGDRGYCSQCPDNQFCLNRNPRRVSERESGSKAQSTKKAEWRLVTRVVDGDTIVVGARERVRLIGVDTPETKHPQKSVEYFGREATAFTRKMVQGKRMRLEFDKANSKIGHKDRFKRTLAYVFLEDGTFLNAEIIKQGYGSLIPGFHSSTWMSLDAMSKRQESKTKGFGVRALRRRLIQS